MRDYLTSWPAMRFFNFSSGTDKPTEPVGPFHRPYAEESTNILYNLLFCDDLGLYRKHASPDAAYPFDVVLSDDAAASDLHTIAQDQTFDPRTRLLAFNRLRAQGRPLPGKALLGVIVEVGLDLGLDALGVFPNSAARYFNQSGRLVIWEGIDDPTIHALTRQLFDESLAIVKRIGPWDQPRRPQPPLGMTRITFLVSDGLYFGEGPTNTFFEDPLAKPALETATRVMQYIARITDNG